MQQHLREANIERVIEVFTVAHKLNPEVFVFIDNMPKDYREVFKQHKEMFAIEFTADKTSYVKYEYSGIDKSQFEPLFDVQARIHDGIENAKKAVKQNPDYGMLVKEGTSNSSLLKTAVSRLDLKPDTISAIHIVAAAVAILDGSFPNIRVEHVAEAVQYYSWKPKVAFLLREMVGKNTDFELVRVEENNIQIVGVITRRYAGDLLKVLNSREQQ